MEEKKCNCNEPYDAEYFQGGYPYCPVHDKRKDTVTQLPVEVAEQIENDSIERFPVTLTHGNHVRPILIQRAAYVTGATAYATDRHHLQQDNAELRRQNDKLKQQATGWRPLLEEVLKHDAAFGELSIEMIDNIKKILYGE